MGAAQGDGLLDFAVHFLERDDVGVGVLFRAVKGAEFAIDVADVGIIDVAVNDVGDDLVAASLVGGGAGQLAAAMGQHPQFLQREAVKAAGFFRADAPAGPNFFQQLIRGFFANHKHGKIPFAASKFN